MAGWAWVTERCHRHAGSDERPGGTTCCGGYDTRGQRRCTQLRQRPRHDSQARGAESRGPPQRSGPARLPGRTRPGADLRGAAHTRALDVARGQAAVSRLRCRGPREAVCPRSAGSLGQPLPYESHHHGDGPVRRGGQRENPSRIRLRTAPRRMGPRPAAAATVRMAPDPTLAFLRRWVRKEALVEVGQGSLFGPASTYEDPTSTTAVADGRHRLPPRGRCRRCGGIGATDHSSPCGVPAVRTAEPDDKPGEH